MVITGAGPGIMEAGIEGAGAERAFGVNILLPFESTSTTLLEGDPKLINYRYFFTRKLTFLKESHAFALLPGGFGTMDEAFELLTLMQTGRSPICPVVLLEPEDGTYWDTWRSFVERELLARRLVDETDLGLVCQCQTVDDAVREITQFYSRYHSMRYVGRRLVIRLKNDITDEHLTVLNRDFGDVVTVGQIERVTASDNERQDDDVPDLPRIAFRFDRWHFARLRALIDAINANPDGPNRRSRSEIVGFAEDVGGLLDGAAGAGQTTFIDRQLGAAGVDRLAQTKDCQVGQFLGDRFQPRSDVVELASHGEFLARR